MTLRQADLAFQANLYESSNPSRHWLHNARRDWVRSAIARHARPQSSILEVGVGCGVYTRDLAGIGDVTGIDINPSFVNAANRIPNVIASIGDVMQLDYEEQFDFALCSEVIEHIPDSQIALWNMALSLRPGGVLVLTTPNSYSTMELFARLLAFPAVARLASAIYGEPVDDLGHINRLTRRQLTHQITRVGLRIVETADIGLYLPAVAEFGGHPGRKAAQWLAETLEGTVLKGALWTQCYVLVRD
jgi:SAM-dependent methyltransferase